MSSEWHNGVDPIGKYFDLELGKETKELSLENFNYDNFINTLEVIEFA